MSKIVEALDRVEQKKQLRLKELSQDSKDKKLLDEVERQIPSDAESKRIEAESDQVENLQSYYESLQVSPEDSLQTINRAYQGLVDLWDPTHFRDNPSQQAKAVKKLREITHAYGKILAFRQIENRLLSGVSPIQISAGPDLLSGDEETPHPFTWWKIILGGGALAVAILAVLFYHSDRIPSGGMTYQAGTNRIDEERWNKPPIWKANPSDAPPDLAPPAPTPELLAKHPIPTSITKSGPAEKAVAGKKEDASESLPSQPTEANGYAIQVSAMRNLNLARAFVEAKKRSGQQIYLVRVNEKNGGVWYRVYIGRFADKAQAARYMEEKKIKISFPESFIQKLP